MADHGRVEYATARGNDVREHESTYRKFVLLAFVGGALVATVIIALAIGGTTGRWGVALPIIFIVAPLVAVHGLATGAKLPSAVLIGLTLLGLALTAAG